MACLPVPGYFFVGLLAETYYVPAGTEEPEKPRTGNGVNVLGGRGFTTQRIG
jgi:hypothetical protein